MRQRFQWQLRTNLAVLLVTTAFLSATRVEAQVPRIGGGAVNFGQVGFGQVYFPPVGFNQVYFPPVGFNQVFFPAVGFNQVAFPMVSPLGGTAGARPMAFPAWGGGFNYDAYRMAKYSIASTRFNTSANATVAQANSLLAQAGTNQMNWGGPRKGGPTDRYNVRSGRSVGGANARPARVRLQDVTSRDGDVLWPLSSPITGELREKRAEANRVIKELLTDRRTQGKVEIPQIVAALDALADYVTPAAEELHRENSENMGGFLAFANRLDTALRNLGGGQLDAD